MPWREVSVMEERREFVRLAMQEGANRRELCRRFGIHPDTGYKWLGRWAGGDQELCDRSRRPHSSPARSDAAMEARVLTVRDAHPAWGARKIARCLEREGVSRPRFPPCTRSCAGTAASLPPPGAPRRARSASRSRRRTCCGRWTSRAGSRLANGMRCHPLTMVDDHSRYVPCLKACADEQGATVQEPSGDDLPALRPAGGPVRRQRRPLGRCLGRPLDPAWRVAA